MKRAVQSQRTSERCERTSERTSEWPSTLNESIILNQSAHLAVIGDTHGLASFRAFAWLGLGGHDGLLGGLGAGLVPGGLGGLGAGGGGHHGDATLEEDVDDGVEERVFALAAESALEIVQVQSPDHTAGQTL